MNLLNKRLQELREEYKTASPKDRKRIKSNAERVKKAMEWKRFKGKPVIMPEPEKTLEEEIKTSIF